ncbi:hypothetical protein D3C84_733950 [compost metagenome]
MITNSLDGFLANATGWHVDHSLKRGIVAAAFEQAHIGHGVFDFRPFEEALTAIDAVRNALAQQGFFQNARLGVGAVQNRDIATGKSGFQRAFDGFDNVTSFVVFIERGVQVDRFAVAAIGPQFFAHAASVVGDQGVGGFENAGRRAIVLLQTNGLGIREII